MALFDAFLKVDGIKGESKDAKHKDEIDIESFSWGLSQSGTASRGGGGGAGKVSFQDFSFVMPVSRASPQLMLACASGKHIKEATLTARKPGKEALEFLKITLSDIVVSGFEQGGSTLAETLPSDQVSFNFEKIKYEYREQRPDGSTGDLTSASWDLNKNSEF
jgi:type VI secretion system secreted protein Hcp